MLKQAVDRRRRARADAVHWRGVAALRRGDVAGGLAQLSEAVRLTPQRRDFLARKADALLLAGHEDEALEAYRLALPDLGALPVEDPGAPALAAHPVWLRHLSRVAVPDAPARSAEAPDTRALANYASLLANRRRVAAAAAVFERVCRADPQDGYAWAALALLHTLNREWQAVIPAAQAARGLGAELFDASMDLCLLSAALGLGRSPGALDACLDWTPLGQGAPDEHLEQLPALAQPMPVLGSRHALVFFIACDARYLREYAVAQVLSIREHCPDAAVHVHLFSPDADCGAVMEWLRNKLAPQPLSVSQEQVDFERFGGVARYCAAARFARLYQWTLRNEARVVMTDADSLVRGDLVRALEGVREVGLLHAPAEPLWHAVPAYLTCFRPGARSRELLGRHAALMAANLGAHRRRLYFMDQVVLYVLARELPEALDYLPLSYCDSTFQPGALAWTVTQAKETAAPFRALQEAVLARAGWPAREAELA